MPEPCSVCWKGAPALPERFEKYLGQVARSVRWKRARPFALRELRTHLLEQKDAFMAEGMEEQAAEEAALEDMGDPAQVGGELDCVHRPHPQWGLLVLGALLSLFGTALRLGLTYGTHAGRSPAVGAAAFLLGLGAMAGMYFLDYRCLVRHAGKVYCLAVFAGLLSLVFSPVVNNTSYYTRYVALCYPAVYGMVVSSLRGSGWKGVFLAIASGLPLVMTALSAPYLLGALLIALVGFVVMLCAAGGDWFGVGAGKTAGACCAVAAAILLPAVQLGRESWFSRRLTVLLHPERDPLGTGYQAMSVRSVLAESSWQGSDVSLERILPNWENDFLLTTTAYKLGWLPCLVFLGLALILMGWMLVKCRRHKNGQLLALSAALTIGFQLLLAIVQNLGWIMGAVSVPFLSGNLHTVLSMALLGLALSAFRQEALPEEQEGPKKKKWKLILIAE